MTVYFVYRAHQQGSPAGKTLHRFDDDTVLDWFRNRWEQLGGGDPKGAYRRAAELFGYPVYGFHKVFERAAEHSLPAPQTDDQLEHYLREHRYAEGELLYSPHLLQVLTDDDELEMAYYFFDDHYLAQHRHLAAFLLHEDWQLPIGQGTGRFNSTEDAKEFDPPGHAEGATWLVNLAYYDGSNLSNPEDPYVVKGVRLPDLARHLLRATPTEGFPSRGGTPFVPRLLRALLAASDESLPQIEQEFLRDLRTSPANDAAWNAYSDWLLDQGRPSAGLVLLQHGFQRVGRYPVVRMAGGGWNGRFLGTPEAAEQDLDAWTQKIGKKGGTEPEKSLLQVEEHISQLCFPTDKWGGTLMYHRWILFDDVWASAHADLANAILRYANRWDVLTPSEA